MQLIILPLDSGTHDRGAFSCGNQNVDQYLHTTAAHAARYFKAATFVLVRVDSPQQIIGFYTLVQHSYRDGELDKTTARALKVDKLRTIPMILLGQLGITAHFQHNGLGKMLLWDALERAFSVAQTIGAVAVITDPHDADAERFYQRFSFQLLQRQPCTRLILPMRTIALAIKQRQVASSVS